MIDLLNGLLDSCTVLLSNEIFGLLLISFTVFYLIVAIVSFLKF